MSIVHKHCDVRTDVFLFTVLVVYDYSITLEREVKCIWNSHWTGPKLLFLLNRYLIFAYAAVSLVSLNSDQVRNKNL